jgi:hypothetical protein
MSRQTRPAAVDSQVRRSMIAEVSVRSRRSQVSCTASSASRSEPSIW